MKWKLKRFWRHRILRRPVPADRLWVSDILKAADFDMTFSQDALALILYGDAYHYRKPEPKDE